MNNIDPTSALLAPNALIIRQKRELAEIFGFETRNKYEILNEQGTVVGFAAEQQKSFLGMLLRQFLGHWRRFEVFFFDGHKQMLFKAKQPFRFFFPRLEIRSANDEPIAALQTRFAFFMKKFDVEDANGKVIYTVRSPFFRFWTFKFKDPRGSEVARVEKKWSGVLSEVFTDRDNFRLQFSSPGVSGLHRYIFIAAAVFIDLNYFEQKAG